MSDEILSVTIAMLSDWGVGTGTGLAGALHAEIEKTLSEDECRQPVVRGTVLAGLVGEQARAAALSLDGGANKGPWQEFADWLFGSESQARHVVFTDATVDPDSPDDLIGDVVSLSISEATGTARQNFLRVFERAAPCVLRGTAVLVDVGNLADPAPAHKGKSTAPSPVEAARFLLGLAGLLVRAIGSNRSDGDGECTILICPNSPKVSSHGLTAPQTLRSSRTIRDWAGAQATALRRALSIPPPPRLPAPPAAHRRASIGPLVADTDPADQTWVEADLDIELVTPLVCYEVPMSNEVRSLDFLRGTAVLAWLHRRLRALAAHGNKDKKLAERVRDAVVHGNLRVSDALPVVDGVRGLPVPLVFQTDKVPAHDDSLDMVNRLRSSGRERVLANRRTGFVFPVRASAPGSEQWRYGNPPLIGRQSTAHDSETGTADEGRLYMVRALPAGMLLRARVTTTKEIADVLRRLQGVEDAMLGSRRLSGAFGHVHCALGRFATVPVLPVPEGETTLWFTSDTLVRSPGLGPGGTWEDLRREFAHRGAELERVTTHEPDISNGAIRHRRIDSWSVADNAPRATRVGIQAGSALRVRVASDDAGMVLARLATLGVGELCPQGYGRFIVGDPLLNVATTRWGRLRATDFAGANSAKETREDS